MALFWYRVIQEKCYLRLILKFTLNNKYVLQQGELQSNIHDRKIFLILKSMIVFGFDNNTYPSK